ncbi:hypothetical protein Paes_2358 (plasmid) [Prosthecochloris aestuarii DSM 271]|uniref:Uncharacterized protein n=1 Tax=Prosthecochloris aestuarii (strain DSM 271 / SK 413) TaxID=290512 RepID=B4S9M2_PROA2|nr:hypothetical protein Paes_2358 [Prosthecochloris aestuarii DSM 271]
MDVRGGVEVKSSRPVRVQTRRETTCRRKPGVQWMSRTDREVPAVDRQLHQRQCGARLFLSCLSSSVPSRPVRVGEQRRPDVSCRNQSSRHGRRRPRRMRSIVRRRSESPVAKRTYDRARQSVTVSAVEGQIPRQPVRPSMDVRGGVEVKSSRPVRVQTRRETTCRRKPIAQ